MFINPRADGGTGQLCTDVGGGGSILEVTDNTRSGQRSGHQGSTQEPNFTRVVRCMFYGQFFIPNSMVLVIRLSGTI